MRAKRASASSSALAILASAALPVAGVFVAGALMPNALMPNASASLLSPAQAVAESVNAGLKEPSVHWSSTADIKGVTISMSTQAGGSSGWQTITESENGESANVTIELVKGAAYMTGNAEGLYLQGLTQTAAEAQASKWLSVPASSPLYEPAVAGLTVRTTMQELQMTGTVKAVAAATIGGHKDPGYKGVTKPFEGQKGMSETLYVSPLGPHLPVKVIAGGATTLFSAWDSAVSVTTPTGAVVVKASWLRSG